MPPCRMEAKEGAPRTAKGRSARVQQMENRVRAANTGSKTWWLERGRASWRAQADTSGAKQLVRHCGQQGAGGRVL